MQHKTRPEWRPLETLYKGTQYQQFLYVVGSADRCKVGISANPKVRADQVSYSSGLPIIDRWILYGHYDPVFAERCAHKCLEEFRIFGEHFGLSVQDALEEIDIDRAWKEPPQTHISVEVNMAAARMLSALMGRPMALPSRRKGIRLKD